MSDVTSQAQDMAAEAAGQAREQIGQAAGQAKGQLRDQLDQRSTQAGQQVSTQAQDLRAVADSLREQGKDQPAKLAEQAAQRAERLGGYLERSDADALLNDIEEFARRQPWAVGLGAAVVGLAGARFLKASSAQRYQSRQTGGHRTPQTPRNGNGRFALESGGASTGPGVDTGFGAGSGAGTGAPVSPPVPPVTPGREL